SPRAVPWAVLLFACSDKLLWHACEAKPYAVDVLAAVGLAALFCLTAAWRPVRRLLLFAALAPVLVFLTYPGCFLCVGLLVALLPGVWRPGRAAVWAGYGVLAGAVFGAFAALVLGPVQTQRCEAMTRCWQDHFPPWDRPGKVPVWAAASAFEVG